MHTLKQLQCRTKKCRTVKNGSVKKCRTRSRMYTSLKHRKPVPSLDTSIYSWKQAHGTPSAPADLTPLYVKQRRSRQTCRTCRLRPSWSNCLAGIQRSSSATLRRARSTPSPACAGQKRSHHFDGTGNSAAKEQLHSPALRKAPGVGQYKRGAQPACKRCDGCVTKKGGCLRRKEDEAATGGDPGNKCRKKVRAADASTSNTPGNAPAQLEQYKRGGSSKKGKSRRGKGPCPRLSSRKGNAKGKSSKGKAEMQEFDLRLCLPSNVPLGPWSWKQHYDEKPTKYNSWPSQQ